MNIGTPDVSVVIPCRNAAPWIAETLASVTSQREVSLEIVLVDDGSDDDSLGTAERVARAVPLTIIRQPPLGASRARNVGTQAARGAFIQYLDADDVLLPTTLHSRVSALREAHGDVAYCDWVRWDEQPDGTFHEGIPVRRTIGDRLELDILNGSAWWPPGALLYRRATVEAITPWREDLPIIQDARFLLDAGLSGARFVHVDHVGLRYRSYAASLSRRSPQAFLEDCFRNGCDLQAKWDSEGSLDAERRRCLAGLYAGLAQSFFPADRRCFNLAIDRLRQLDPRFLPDGPPTLRALARLGGYTTAVHVATWFRQVKALVRRTT